MTRQVNAAGLAIADNAEGCVLTGYLDPVGKPTAGRGHTGPDVKVGKSYTQAQADAWEAQDMAKAAAFVESRVKVPLNDNQFSALSEFTFNVGIGNFAGSTLLRLLNKGDYAAVPAQLARWTKGRIGGRTVILPGLVTRRAHEAALFAMPEAHTLTIPPAPSTAASVTVRPVAPSLVERLRAWWHGTIRTPE